MTAPSRSAPGSYSLSLSRRSVKHRSRRPRPRGVVYEEEHRPAASGCSDTCVARSVTMGRFDRGQSLAQRGRAGRRWLEVVQRTYEVSGPVEEWRCRVAAGHGAALWRHAARFSSRPCRKPSERSVGVMARRRRRKCAVHVPIGGSGRGRSSAACRHMTLLDLLWTARMLERGVRACAHELMFSVVSASCAHLLRNSKRRRK